MVGAMPAEALPCKVIGNDYGAKHLHLRLPPPPEQQPAAAECKWYEEEIDDDLKLCYALNSMISTLSVTLIQALIIDGKMQSTEMDEFIYHESLIHPPLLFHPNPRTVFIMGGGEGSAAREIQRHKTVERVVMCDIDQEVVDFCRTYLTVNREAFSSDKLCLIINDARVELEKSREKFDVIVGDLADPVEGGPCYQLYTKSFYEHIVKPKLNDHGIFVTQAGPAGVLTHKEVFSSVYNTLKHVFKYVQAYTAHVPSFADTWGWVMASDHPFDLNAQQMNERIEDRIEGELVYLSGESLISSTTLNKSVHQS
ncbi:Thermospermine synthase ACAULIS5 [Dichanthelium oligosanthes]|uniref:Thermospermine synthase ACAULIS5 n=1 Tax=Dichanthelium oligosanthes TaxID=888268 RepID=A0A1E5UQB2_9POAL|nr:Thermospermine synthase ACAULIS5 [Dichanthelium oligosanthes]